MSKKSALLIICILGALSFVRFSGCHDRGPDRTSSPVKTTLKAVIDLDWDRNLLEMPALFPGGQMRRGDIESKRHACYTVAITLTDIGAEGKLWLHQSEEYIQTGAGRHLTHRIVVINNASQDEQDRRFNEICTYIKGMHQHVFTTINPSHSDASFTIDPLSRDEYAMISIKKDHPQANTLSLEIQQATRVKDDHLTKQLRETSR